MKIKVPAAKLLPGDVILCVIVAMLAVLILFIQAFRPSGADYVEIFDDCGKTSYSLSVNREIKVESNSYTLSVVIEDGAVSVTASDCPDHICVDMGEISKSGESIICVPAQVVVTVGGESEVDHALR